MSGEEVTYRKPSETKHNPAMTYRTKSSPEGPDPVPASGEETRLWRGRGGRRRRRRRGFGSRGRSGRREREGNDEGSRLFVREEGLVGIEGGVVGGGRGGVGVESRGGVLW
jgi:hypothetical protein